MSDGSRRDNARTLRRKADVPTFALDSPIDSLKALLTRREHFNKLAGLLLLGEAVLCCLIIQFVPCEYLSARLQNSGRRGRRVGFICG